MNDLKFTTAEEYIKDSQEPPESCFIIEGKWAKENIEEKNEKIMGREVQTKNNQ
jgi:hypothetical protein